MEKKKYVKPILASEEFIPQEYIATCGTQGKQYKFVCDANSEGWFTDSGIVHLESGAEKGFQLLGPNKDPKYKSYMPCKTVHYASTEDEFLDGWLVSTVPYHVIQVKVWKGEDGNNVHCTKNIHMDTWEILKS